MSSRLIKEHSNQLICFFCFGDMHSIRIWKLPIIGKFIIPISYINITWTVGIKGKFRRIFSETCRCNSKLRNWRRRFNIYIHCIQIFISNFIFYSKFYSIVSRLFKLFFNFLSLQGIQLYTFRIINLPSK